MLNFGASKPRVGGAGPPRPPPWIRTCKVTNYFCKTKLRINILIHQS